MKTAFLLSAPYDQAKIDLARAGKLPRPDYILITEALGADLLTPVPPNAVPKGKLRNFIRKARVAWAGFRQRKKYDLIISDLENVGLILALLLKLSRSKTRHVMICHAKVVTPMAVRFIKLFGLNKYVDSYICYGPRIKQLMEVRLPETNGKVQVIYHPADHRFWQPNGVEPERLITIAGMLGRDFETFLKAIEGLDVSVHIAGFSPWVAEKDQPLDADRLPPNVTVGKLPPLELRELFNRSLLVALPLFESDGQDGSLVMYESMACGKPIIATQTRGQRGMGLVKDGENGFGVEVGDVEGWRRLVQRFLDEPELAATMGQRSRQIVETGLNLECWTEHLAENVKKVLATPRS